MLLADDFRRRDNEIRRLSDVTRRLGDEVRRLTDIFRHVLGENRRPVGEKIDFKRQLFESEQNVAALQRTMMEQPTRRYSWH